MTEQSTPTPNIADEAAFCKALGLDPNVVKAGSMSLRLAGGQVVIEFAVMQTVPTHMAGIALMAAAGHQIVDAEGKPEEPKDNVRPLPKKTTPRKTAAKKTSPPKGGSRD